MEQIVIKKANGNTLPLFSKERPSAISKATQKVALLSDDLVSLTVVSAQPIDFDFGDTITVFGKPYRLNQLPEPTKEGERKFTYEITFEGVQYDLIDVVFHLPEASQDNPERVYYGEYLYGDLEEHLKCLLWNINRIYNGKWKLGTYPKDTDVKNITATGKNCLQVLQEYCEQYGVEFEIGINASDNTYTLNVKEKIGGTFTQPLQYGRGKGLYKLQRKNVNNAGITTRLYVYGGNSNLGSKYGHTRLCLHGQTRLTSFVEDTVAKAKYGIKENEKTFEDINPERVGTITALGANTLTFADSSMFDLNQREADGTTTKYLIPDTTAKITFQTGNLAGYSFDVHSYNHNTHTFVINKFTDENGLVFPNETSAAFQFAVGDKYIITDINLPDEYILDAENKLKEAAEKELANICQPQVSYTLQLDEQFFTRIYGRSIPAEVLHVGDYLHVIDEQVGVDKEIRITQIERDLLKPHTYTIQVSDTLTKTTTVRVLNDLQNLNEVVTINRLANPTVARRRWKTAQELLSMVFDPDGDYYTDRIKPLSVDTSMLSVGAKSQQFVLQNVTFEPNYNGSYVYLHITAGYLTHYAIDPDNILTRAMPESTFTLDTSSAYYIYASWQRAGNGTSWLISKEQKKVDSNGDEWLFLVGTVSSPVREGTKAVRSVALTYGFSTVNGRFIKTGRIESTAGTCYFDLDNNEIGGVIRFVKSDGTIGRLSDVDDRTSETKDYINNTLPGILNELQAQLDGQIEQFFYDYDPDDENEPTSDWIAADTASGTNTEKENHLGDLFYNTDTGKVFRYVKERKLVFVGNGKAPAMTYVYRWQQLTDEELQQALQLANDALDLAGEKRRIFTATPYPPYDVGDLWVQGASGDIMRCKTARASGNYNANDWEKASKYTDDTALRNFISNEFATTVETITEQIDGKIESYWQSNDPSTGWNTAELAQAHNGDMWYNTANGTLWRWRYYLQSVVGEENKYTYGYWQQIQDQKAIDAYEAALAAKDVADGKRRVFVATPYPPYDVGDLWLTGGKSDGVLMRCITSRAAGSKYNANDWAEAVYYDNTKTTIDGGIVTSGTVQLVSPVSESIVAGITGGEDETDRTIADGKVRIWAGASKANRFTAPFRVLQDGSVYATKANIEGTVKATDGEFNGMVKIGGGKTLLNKDGSGQLANGNVNWDSYGNVTLKNITATGGTFDGLLNVTRGIRYKVRINTNAGCVINNTDTFVIYAYNGVNSSSCYIYMPSNPYDGEVLYLKNTSGFNIPLTPNGHNIIEAHEIYAKDIKSIKGGQTFMFIYSSSRGYWYIMATHDW